MHSQDGDMGQAHKFGLSREQNRVRARVRDRVRNRLGIGLGIG